VWGGRECGCAHTLVQSSREGAIVHEDQLQVCVCVCVDECVCVFVWMSVGGVGRAHTLVQSSREGTTAHEDQLQVCVRVCMCVCLGVRGGGCECVFVCVHACALNTSCFLLRSCHSPTPPAAVPQRSWRARNLACTHEHIACAWAGRAPTPTLQCSKVGERWCMHATAACAPPCCPPPSPLP